MVAGSGIYGGVSGAVAVTEKTQTQSQSQTQECMFRIHGTDSGWWVVGGQRVHGDSDSDSRVHGDSDSDSRVHVSYPYHRLWVRLPSVSQVLAIYAHPQHVACTQLKQNRSCSPHQQHTHTHTRARAHTHTHTLLRNVSLAPYSTCNMRQVQGPLMKSTT